MVDAGIVAVSSALSCAPGISPTCLNGWPFTFSQWLRRFCCGWGEPGLPAAHISCNRRFDGFPSCVLSHRWILSTSFKFLLQTSPVTVGNRSAVAVTPCFRQAVYKSEVRCGRYTTRNRLGTPVLHALHRWISSSSGIHLLSRSAAASKRLASSFNALLWYCVSPLQFVIVDFSCCTTAASTGFNS